MRDEPRIIMVVTGFKSMKERSQELERLIEWAYREFGSYTLFKAGETVEEADVWLGAQHKVSLTTVHDAVFSVPRRFRKDMKVTVV